METIIGNCKVTIEDGGCWVERDGFSGSLAALEATGVLCKDVGELRIATATINQIVAFAEKHADLTAG